MDERLDDFFEYDENNETHACCLECKQWKAIENAHLMPADFICTDCLVSGKDFVHISELKRAEATKKTDPLFDLLDGYVGPEHYERVR